MSSAMKLLKIQVSRVKERSNDDEPYLRSKKNQTRKITV